MAPCNVTEIVNNTQQVLNMTVGNSLYFVDLAKIRSGAKHTMLVDYCDTYQEYKFCVNSDGDGNNLIVTSDDCCDCKCITIIEVNGKLDVQTEPRVEAVDVPSAAKKHCNSSSWKLWTGIR